MRLWLLTVLLACHCTSHAIDKFDIKVCEAQADDVKKVECYSRLLPDAYCNNLDSPKRLSCLRDSSKEEISFATIGWKHAGMFGRSDMVLIHRDKEADKPTYLEAIRSVCGTKDWCKILFWSDPALVPKNIPMTDAQIKGQTASWVRNNLNEQGFSQMLWACRIDGDPNRCFSH